MENEEMLQETIPEAEESVETENTEATPKAEDIEAETDMVAEQTDEPFVVRFNHADKELTKDEAKQYAQKGLKLDSMAEMLNDLSYYAALKGTSTHEAVKNLINDAETSYKNEVIEKYGDDDEIVEMMMERFRTSNKQKFEAFKKAEQAKEEAAESTIEARIADEFIELKKEFPDITDIKSVPKDVLKDAYNGKNLTDSYLRYLHRENKKVASAKQTAQNNAQSTAGKMVGEGNETNSFMDAFLKGLQS